MAQATDLPTTSRFHNLSSSALADALGHADAVLKGAEAECKALKDEIKRRGLLEAAGNSFTVKPGTYFYVNVVFFDDSEPIIGDWPADKAGAAEYIFGRDQLGGHDLAIEVDGKVTSLDL